MRSGQCSGRERLQQTEQMTEVRGQIAEDRKQRAEDRRRKTEGRGQKTEGRGQKIEDGRQRAEDRKQRTEGGGQKTDGRGIGIRISECGLRPAGAIGACAPEGMRNDGIALLSLFLSTKRFHRSGLRNSKQTDLS